MKVFTFLILCFFTFISCKKETERTTSSSSTLSGNYNVTYNQLSPFPWSSPRMGTMQVQDIGNNKIRITYDQVNLRGSVIANLNGNGTLTILNQTDSTYLDRHEAQGTYTNNSIAFNIYKWWQYPDNTLFYFTLSAVK